MIIKNETNSTLTIFDARYLDHVSTYSLDELQQPDMLERLRELPRVNQSLIELKPGASIRCKSYGFDTYYVYCETGVCIISNELDDIELSCNGILSVSETGNSIVISAT